MFAKTAIIKTESHVVEKLNAFLKQQGLDTRVHSKAKTLEVYLELAREVSLGDFLRSAQEKGFDVRDVQRESGGENGSRAYIATMKVQKRRNLVALSDEIRELPGVVFLECL